MGQLRDAVNETFRDYVLPGVVSSGEHEPIKSEIRDTLGRLLETILSGIGSGILRYATKAAMDAVTDKEDGQLAYVYDDATAANNKVYQWDDGGNAWVAADWYFDAVAGVVDEHLEEAILARGTMFLEEADDEFARAFFREIRIGGMDKNDVPWLQYELSYFPGIPLWRYKFHLYSTNYNILVARKELSFSSDPSGTLPEWMNLANMADGSHAFGADPGISAALRVDWEALVNNGGISSSTVANTGIKADAILPPEAISQRYSVPALPAPPESVINVGASGDFPTLVGSGSAWEFLEQGDFASTISRTTYPSSDKVSPERPLIVRVNETGFTEEITPFSYLGVDQSPLRIHHGLQLHLPYRDTLIFMDQDVSTAPTVEFNFTGRIYGDGRIQRTGAAQGYVLHVDDGNGISDASDVDPMTLRRTIQTVIEGVTLQKSNDGFAPIIGSGISNGHLILLDGCNLIMDTNAAGADFVFIHSSPGTTHAGLIWLRGVTSNVGSYGSGVAMLSLFKSHAMTVRHGLLVQDSDCPRIEVGNSAGGASGFIRRCSLAGITVTGDLAP